MAPTYSSQAEFAVDTALPFDTSSIPIEFQSESIQKQGQILETAGIRGTRAHNKERTRTGPYAVSGTITTMASRLMLDTFLPAIMGGSESSNVFSVAETLQELYFMIDRGAKVFTYSGVKVNRATFRGTEQGFIEVSLDIEAETETVGNAGTFPSLTMPTEKPYVFTDGVLTLQSSSREMKSFELVIDNVLDTARFHNSLTRTEIPSTDRIVNTQNNSPLHLIRNRPLRTGFSGCRGYACVYQRGSIRGRFDVHNGNNPVP